VDSSVLALASPSRLGANRGQANASGERPTKGLAAQQRGEAVLENFRRIYLSMYASADQAAPVIGVTSTLEDEGRTTVASGIAAAMAADLEAPVVLVEADLAHPGMHRVFGFASSPGLCEYLRGECELATALRQVSERLFVLPAGEARGEVARRTRQLISTDLRQRLTASGATLVFDLPPVLASSYGVLAAGTADVLAFVVRSGKTTDVQVRDALSRLSEMSVRGLVLNGAKPQLPRWLSGRE
jgi:Mrp family chromosome partitioning ATPase